MSELLEKIRSRGYWKVVIHPATFMEKRVSNIAELYPLLQKISVQLRGWDFPHLDTQTKLHIDKDWIGQDPEWEEYLELWRFYQSGQFVDFMGLDEDWRDQSKLRPPPGDWKPCLFLDVKETVFQLTEIFEFASRLSLTEAGDDQMHLEIAVSGLKDRLLRVEPRRVPLRPRKASIQEFPYSVDLSRTELITASRELALKPAVELFQRFGWDPGLDILRDMQYKFLHRGSQVAGRS